MSGHDHDRILELGAASIDFELTPSETAELDRGLEACPACRRRVSSMRATAGRLGHMAPLETPERVRDVVLRAAGGGRRPAARSFGLLLAAGLTVGVLLAGGVLLVGAPNLPPAPSVAPSIATAPSPSTDAPSPSAPAETSTPVASTPSLEAGALVTVVSDQPLVVRSAPGRGSNSAELPNRLHPGQRAVVLRGPVSASGYDWVQIQTGSREGWVAIASQAGSPWVAPIANGAIASIGRDDDGAAVPQLIDADGTVRWRLSDEGLSRAEHLAWSPDGAWLAFIAKPDPETKPELYIVAADGSELRRLTTDTIENDSPAWAPDSGRLVVHQRGDPSGLVVVGLDGSSSALIANGVGGTWSHDRRRIAYSAPAARGYELSLVNPDGTEGRSVSEQVIPGQTPAFSPDSQRFAVLAGNWTTGCTGICVIDRPTGAVDDIGEGSGVPVWSPRGRDVLTVDRVAGGLLVTVLPVDGGVPLGLPAPDGVTVDDVFAPVWSPDGRYVLATVLVEGEWRLAIAAADGSGTTLFGESGSFGDLGAAWQPVPVTTTR